MREKIKELKDFLKDETPKKYAAVLAAIIALTLVLELFVFNYKWLGSAFCKTEDVKPSVSSGASVRGNEISFSGDSGVIEYHDLNKEIKYLYFKPGNDKEGKASITVSAVDEANSSALSAPERTVVADVKQSQYIRLHFSGEIKDLKITVKGMNGKSITSDCIALNTHVPLMFSWVRFLIVLFTLMILYILRPKSFIYKYKTNLKNKYQLAVVILVVIVQSVFFWNMIHYNTNAVKWHQSYENHRQYYNLIESFKDGRVYLTDAPEKLISLNNPYDIREREKEGVDYKWDHVYYDGKYYVYFGALPAVLLYLPYNLITGSNLPNYIAVFIFGIMIMIGILLLLWEIIRKWYRKTPFALYLMLSVVFGAVSGLAYAIQKPDFYLIPSLSALMFALFGLAFWLSAERKTDNGETKLIPWRLVLGSLFIALTAGCRPQFLLAAVFGVMLFWNHAFKKRTLFSKEGLKPTISVCLPFIIVGAVVMWYNAARFGSPFDFGANYNLTTNDMTHRGFVFGRTGLGIFTYFLQPFSMNALFPFIHDFSSATAYQGLTLTEKLMGGVLWLYPVLLIGVYGAFKKNVFSDKRAYRMVYFSVIMAVVLGVLDAQMAGLLTRYFTDFVWLLMIASAVTVFAYYDRNVDNIKIRSRVVSITTILSVTAIILAFLSIFAHSEDSIQAANPTLYYTVQHLIAFWL